MLTSLPPNPLTGKGKKSKTITKQGSGVVRQWDIMKMMLDESEIPEFVDPIKWLKYFPPLGKVDLQKFGTCTVGEGPP